jgi:hypothetical protein
VSAGQTRDDAPSQAGGIEDDLVAYDRDQEVGHRDSVFAFRAASPLAMAKGVAVLRPDIAGVMRAVYGAVLPARATDPSHALRLSARMGQLQ